MDEAVSLRENHLNSVKLRKMKDKILTYHSNFEFQSHNLIPRLFNSHF